MTVSIFRSREDAIRAFRELSGPSLRPPTEDDEQWPAILESRFVSLYLPSLDSRPIHSEIQTSDSESFAPKQDTD